MPNTYRPCALIIKDAYKADAEAVLTAYRGETIEFGRALVPVTTVDPSPSSTPTHWLIFDAATKYDDVFVYMDFVDNTLPPLADPAAQWGANGLIGEIAARLSVNGVNLQVYPTSGDVDPTEFVEGQNGEGGLLRGRGLMYRPLPAF